jgi:copper(I)-binding protein
MISRSRRAFACPRRAGPDASALVLTACLLALGTAHAATAHVSVTGARLQVLIAARPAAGYFTLRNTSQAPLSLTGASAPDCGSLMLHRSVTSGGMARMEMVGAVTIPPQGTVSFAPGGYHLMCMNPSGPLLTHTGTEPVTLMFAGGGTVQVPFRIEGVKR